MLLTLISFTGYSQKSGIITYKAFYNESPATEDIKKQSEAAYYAERQREEIAKTLRFELHYKDGESLFFMTDMLNSDGFDATNVMTTQSTFNGLDTFYTNVKTDEALEVAEILGQKITIKSKISNIEWKLTPETKTIDGHKCYKATTTYKFHWSGKDRTNAVTAWYDPAIPVKLGPTRYAGLPGLILELNEDYRTWVVEKIDFKPEKKPRITKPNDKSAITRQELDAKVDDMRQKFISNARG